MSCKIGTLNRSLSYPSNLQHYSPNISLSDFTTYLVPSYTNKSPSMYSDNTSTNTVFFTQFNNLTTLTLKPQMNSRTPSLAHPLFPKPLFNHSIPKLPINLSQRLLSTLMQPQFSPQRPATHVTPLAPLMKNLRMNK